MYLDVPGDFLSPATKQIFLCCQRINICSTIRATVKQSVIALIRDMARLFTLSILRLVDSNPVWCRLSEALGNSAIHSACHVERNSFKSDNPTHLSSLCSLSCPAIHWFFQYAFGLIARCHMNVHNVLELEHLTPSKVTSPVAVSPAIFSELKHGSDSGADV